ncbi:MAG: DUF45 domain-containing protein [Sphingomonas sp.]|nr:DUF45 domain-containing protein [Sphingomonas sp.]
MRLRFDEREQLLKLTHPVGIRASAALSWAAAQSCWVNEQLRNTLPPEPLIPGATIPIEGEEIELCWAPAEGRVPALAAGTLVCGGPREAFPRRIEQFLKRRAVETLSSETAEISGRSGCRATSVTVGDARTRWGSCSSSGRIRYNWRLILASPEARRFVVAHEVAHLRHLDHGARFKALERELFSGDIRAAEALLRSSGPRLRRIGLGG